LPDTKQEEKEVEKEMKDSEQELEQEQNSKASESQKQASDKMKDMSNKMKQQMADNEQEQAEEDIKALRQLLENLVQLSFDQERLIEDVKATSETTPRYVRLTQQQHKLKGDFELIEDSLHALSKRVMQIQSFVSEKVSEINQNMTATLKELEERHRYAATEPQQRTMKNVNDLALMLSEAMNQMQQQQQSQSNKPGSKACKKPGNGQGKTGKVPKDKMSQGQQDLNKMLQDMKDRMGKGQKGGMSKEFAQMAAKQAAIRQALREKLKEAQQRGKGADKGMDELMKDMEKTETELVNKVLTNETLKRQANIETRLLESDRAERERKQDEQRKADVAKARQPETPPSLEEYLRKRQSEVEMYRTSSPALKPYYKQLVEDYIKQLKGK
jgi:DNA repair exonuclease SbcCD ATPase subunit